MREAWIAQQEEIRAAARARKYKIADRWIEKLSHYVYTLQPPIEGEKLPRWKYKIYDSYVEQLISHPDHIIGANGKRHDTGLGTLNDFTRIMENKSDAELNEQDPDITPDEIVFWTEVKDSLRNDSV
jgi:hypothetical protein